MKKIFSRIVVIAIVLAGICASFAFAGQKDRMVSFADGNPSYTIENYDVKIDVAENNILTIVETIDANFTESAHGIIRDIPTKVKLLREDGSRAVFYPKVTNISIMNAGKMDEPSNAKYTVSSDSEMCSLKIGDANKTILGEQKYIIKYDYNLGKDTLKKADEFYFNIIGTEWNTTIDNVTFTINMPKDFESSKSNPGFVWGKYGMTNTSDVTFSVEGKTISGSLDRKLEKYEGFTIRLTLPDGYIVGASETRNMVIRYIGIFAPIACLVLVFLLWFLFGRDEKLVKPIAFFPPKGMNSLDVAFAYKGNISFKDVSTLLVYLAQKGYLTIECDAASDEVTLFEKKPYDGTDPNEKLFFEKVFNNRKTVTISELINSKFGDDIKSIVTKQNTKEKKEKYFTKASLKLVGVPILMIIISFATMMLTSVLESGLGVGVFLLALFPLISIFMVLSQFFNKTDFKTKFVVILFACFFGVISSFFMVAYISFDEYVIAGIVTGTVAIILESVLFVYMPQRTSEGRTILGQIAGFREFLIKAEKPKLEMLVNENPQYYYNILPYAYVLGVSKKWISKFENIAIPQAEWCNTPFFSITILDNFSRNAFISTMPKGSSSDGGFSGGGSSGGGGGGGGGSSW